MNQYNNVNEDISSTPHDESKLAANNAGKVTLRLLSNMVGNSTDKQVSELSKDVCV